LIDFFAIDFKGFFWQLPPMSSLSVKKSPLYALCTAALDLLLPPRCPMTGSIVDAPGMLSADAWPQLSFVESPMCATCGTPFHFQAPGETLCANCLDHPPVFDKARAAVTYNDASRKIILSFKYGDSLHAVHTFTPWLQRAGKDLIENTDIILPVPLHRYRLWQRRFNQSALLAKALAQKNGKIFLPDALLRLRHTKPQKGLSRKERNDNVKNAFDLSPHGVRAISGRRILLIDDVFTSGATLNECARALKKSGAAAVFILTIARVTREEF
jgi:ComF family protein